MKENRLTENMEHISRLDFTEHIDDYLERVVKEDIGFVITDKGKDDIVLCPANWFEASADKDFECIVGCALRYAIGRNTYMPSLVSDFIKNHIEIFDINSIAVMIEDIDRELSGELVQKDVWLSLKSVLEQRKAELLVMQIEGK